MSKLDTFAKVFQLPPAMIPYIDYVVTEQEMDLVVGLGDEAMNVEQIADMMGISLEETEDLVKSAYHRTVIKKGPGRGPYARSVLPEEGPTTYSAAVFYRRLDPIAMYEDWGDVPVDAREAVIEWQLQEFIDIWQPAIEEIRKNPDARVPIPNRDYLLLHEALELVDAATDHAVIPCDCKEIVRACDVPTEHCVYLDQGAMATLDRGHGRRVTKEEMKQIVIDANLNGLMATGDRDQKKNGHLFGFCNCCACDCYPIRAGKKLGMGDAYPRVYYIAARDMDKCLHCGTCATRCHFDAFYQDGSRVEIVGKRGGTIRPRQVLFNPDECRGCGVCATTCSEGAITMELRPTQEVEAA